MSLVIGSYLAARALIVLIGVLLLLKRKWVDGVLLIAFGGATHIGLLLTVDRLEIIRISFWAVILWFSIWLGLALGLGYALKHLFPKKKASAVVLN